jgi:hypothetical protein
MGLYKVWCNAGALVLTYSDAFMVVGGLVRRCPLYDRWCVALALSPGH